MQPWCSSTAGSTRSTDEAGYFPQSCEHLRLGFTVSEASFPQARRGRGEGGGEQGIWVPFLYLVLTFSLHVGLELSEMGCCVSQRAGMSKTRFCQGSWEDKMRFNPCMSQTPDRTTQPRATYLPPSTGDTASGCILAEHQLQDQGSSGLFPTRGVAQVDVRMSGCFCSSSKPRRQATWRSCGACRSSTSSRRAPAWRSSSATSPASSWPTPSRPMWPL